jgi:hypothetical protein
MYEPIILRIKIQERNECLQISVTPYPKIPAETDVSETEENVRIMDILLTEMLSRQIQSELEFSIHIHVPCCVVIPWQAGPSVAWLFLHRTLPGSSVCASLLRVPRVLLRQPVSRRKDLRSSSPSSKACDNSFKASSKQR